MPSNGSDRVAARNTVAHGRGEAIRPQEVLLKTGALQEAIFNSANFSSIATDENGVIQIFNAGAERMLGYLALEVVNKISPADISDPQEMIERAAALSLELDAPITPGFDALVFKAARGVEDIYEITYICKDGSRFPALVSVTALRDAQDRIIGYLLISTDNTARNQAKLALEKSEGHYTKLFNTMFEGFCIVEVLFDTSSKAIDYRFIETNKAFEAQTGLLGTKGKRIRELAPGLEEYWFEIYGKVALTGEPVHFVHEAKAFNRWYEVSAQRFGDASCRHVCILFQDVTARMRAEQEQALVDASALQNAIFNSANFSSIATDEKGVIQIFNVGAERMLGYTAAEVVNKITPADISDPQELIARADALSLQLATTIKPGFEALVFKASRGIEDIYELTYIRKDRSRFAAIVSVTALRDAKDDIIGYLLIGTDNTARKEVEANQALLDQRLRDQQFYTRSLIESNVDALMTTDPQGIITDVNQQMIALSGRTRDELIGAPCKNFFTEPARADAAIKRVLAENKLSNYEMTVRAPNGEETVVSYNAATFHNRERELQGVFAAARDVTELKRIEHALQVKNVELEHASRMKSEFLATMSHELRTPLNAIIGFSEALKDGLIGQMSDTQHEYIGDIFTSGQHLLSLINDILDLSKVEAGMMALEFEPFDLNSLLSSSLAIVREKALAQSVTLEFAADEDLGIQELDVRKTKQIVYNLLSNAVKFSARGGHVGLHACRVPRDQVGKISGTWPVHAFPLAYSEFDEFVEIGVRDRGIGLSEESMARLFRAFSQIDSSLARKFEGTGLGLAMVKQMTELHGGTVAVASAEGEGAYFVAWLPVREPSQSIATVRPGGAHAVLGQKERTALIVEDDDLAADLIRVLLEQEGFAVLRATSAEAALLIAPQQALSLITLDIRLPGMDGWTFLEHLRSDTLLAQVPVVVASGCDGIASSIALARGATATLQKPISRAQLKAALANLGLHPAQGHARTVLVVDDDPKAVEVIAAFLPSPDYTVLRAYGGGEAIDVARRMCPNLILLDLMMPDINGFDVVQALQRDSATAHIPIVVVTAKQITEQDRIALNGASGADINIVAKPGFNRRDFIAEVRRALQPH